MRFFDPINGWEGWGQFSASNVHKQYGISLLSPAYTHPLTGAGVRRVRVELVKPSDGATSEHVDFYYTNTSNIAGQLLLPKFCFEVDYTSLKYFGSCLVIFFSSRRLFLAHSAVIFMIHFFL